MGLLQKHWNSKSGTSINVIRLLMSFISRVFVLPFRSILTCVRLDYQPLFGRGARAPRPDSRKRRNESAFRRRFVRSN